MRPNIPAVQLRPQAQRWPGVISSSFHFLFAWGLRSKVTDAVLRLSQRSVVSKRHDQGKVILHVRLWLGIARAAASNTLCTPVLICYIVKIIVVLYTRRSQFTKILMVSGKAYKSNPLYVMKRLILKTLHAKCSRLSCCEQS